MWPSYEHEEARMQALKQRLMAEADAQRQLKALVQMRRKRRTKLLRTGLYRVGGWMRHWGESLQRRYHEDRPSDETRWAHG